MVAVLALAFGLVGCSVKPPEQESPEPPSPPPVEPRELAPPVPVEEPAERETTDVWRERFDYWYENFLGDQPPPEVGETVAITLRGDDRVRRGVLLERTDEGIKLRVGDSTATYPPQVLSRETLVALYPERTAQAQARRKVQQEREQAAMRERSGIAVATEGAPEDMGADGLVPAVDEYIRSHARDADSVEYVKWFPLQKHKNGHYVRCQYLTDGGSFGKILADKVFVLDRRGRVVSTTTGLAKF